MGGRRETTEAFARLDDELCTWPAEPRLYTRGNGADQWPNPLTPLTQTAVAAPQIAALPFTFTQRLRLIEGVPPEDCAGIFYGYVAVGLEPTLRMADVMPGWSAQAVGEQYFGLPPDPAWSAPPTRTKRTQVAGVMVRVLRESRRYPRAATRFERDARKRWDEARNRDWRSAADAELVAEFDWHAANAMVQRVPLLVANMVAAAGYEQLVTLATRWAGAAGPELAARAVSGIGGIQTSDAIGALDDVVAGRLTREAWVARYGFRGPVEYELASHPWGEDEAYVTTLLDQARDRGRDAATEADPSESTVRAVGARKELARRAGVRRRPMLALVLRNVERHLRWRENAKVHEVLAIARLRLAARESATRLFERGGIDAADDGFFLTVDELTSDIALATPPDRRAEVSGRRAVNAAAQAIDLPELFLAEPGGLGGVPPERIRALGLIPPMKDAPTKDASTKDAAPTGDRVLRGIGVSPGQATAPVQVVTDPYAPGLEPGEVLVAHTTDPAWTPLFLTASAVVIDLGGPLSHGAVIARELGIPCVINVKHASTQLASGEVVTVDGTAGEVYPQPGSAAQKLLPPSTLTSAPLT